MFFKELFNWTENKKIYSYSENKKNDQLIKELIVDGISDKKILSVIKKIPRKFFVDKHSIDNAYKNNALCTDCGQTISQPYVVAYMIESLKLKNTDRILEIGTGTGWQTAILANLCREVFTIERFNNLLDKAKKNISRFNIKNVNYKLGNGFEGWGEKILFDSIIISAASKMIPPILFKNLKPNGNLIFPKKYLSGNQKLLLIKKNDRNYFDQKELLDVKFVPLINDKSIR